MTLPIDFKSDDYRFCKTLNEDVQVKPNTTGKWDLQMSNGDYVNVTGKQSLQNAICIAIMTIFGELRNNPLYNEFGCHIHELLKLNKSEMVLYEVELFVTETLEKMRRIKEINFIEVTESDVNDYHVSFNVTNINDEIVNGSVEV